MKKECKKIEKLCSFYVSDWHLTTMVLPYINQKIDENIEIITILENNIEENIKILLQKLNLKNEQEILKLNWESNSSKKYDDIAQQLNKKAKNNRNIIFLVNGTENYIKANNRNIEKWLQNSKIESVKIINFFEVTDFNSKMTEILNSHDKVFNTSGEKEISDVFKGYVKKQIDEKQNIV